MPARDLKIALAAAVAALAVYGGCAPKRFYERPRRPSSEVALED